MVTIWQYLQPKLRRMTLGEITAHQQPVIWPNMSFSPELERHSGRRHVKYYQRWNVYLWWCLYARHLTEPSINLNDKYIECKSAPDKIIEPSAIVWCQPPFFLGSRGQDGDLPLRGGTIYPLGTLTATSHVPPLHPELIIPLCCRFPLFTPIWPSLKHRWPFLSQTSNKVF